MPQISSVIDESAGVRIAHVTLDRPEKLNALNLEMLDGLIRVAHDLRRDRALRGVVVSGAGDSFCAGLDFASTFKRTSRVVREFAPRPWRGTNTFQEACWGWRRIPVPVVAAVHGHCYGGGLQIALGADVRYTTPDAKWSVLESKWGLVPDMSGMQALSEQVGLDEAKILTMTGRVVSGTEAALIGLATESTEDPAQAAFDLIAEIATRSPDAVAAAKGLFNRTWHRGPRFTFARERLAQARLLVNPNTKLAREAAFTGDTPVFTGRKG